MTRKILSLTAAALLATAAPLAAFAADGPAESYPRVVGSGENASIDYGPGGQGNVVGGGTATVRQLGNGEIAIVYGDASAAQTRSDGRVPVVVGTGESAEIRWVPAAQAAPSRLATGDQGYRG